MLFCSDKQTRTAAKLIERQSGHCIVASFVESSSPVICQIGLGGGQDIIISLREDNEIWTIGTIDKSGAFKAIAKFDNVKDAEDAYASLQKAVLKGKSFLQTNIGRWLASILIAFILLLLVDSVFNIVAEVKSVGSSKIQQTEQTTTSSDQMASPEQKVGVPIPADEVLKPPAD